jgi:HK97 family phage prohead protease
MPYYISNDNPECTNWAVEKEDGEVIGCHNTKQDAIDQMVAVSIAEDMKPGGERARPGTLMVGDYVSWNSSGGRARGEIVRIETDGVIAVPDTDFEITGTPDDPAALIQVYQRVEGGWEDTDVFVGHKFSTLTRIAELEEPDDEYMDEDESRQVNLTPPAYMRAAARQGLRYYEEGLGGDGLVDRTIREARAMANGTVTADKWVRIRAWIARHLVDLDVPAAQPGHEDYPSPGVVAHLLWGSGPSKRAAQRALDYAEGVVTRIEAENEGRAKGEALSKIETRIHTTEFEIRQDETGGMMFEGYAAVFNSPSEPLPFVERIAPGAFRGSLRMRNDIKMLWNHDTGAVLGSTRAKTLYLEEDDRGLKVRAMLPNTTLGRDTAELIRRGDVSAMSFGFSVPKNGDSWNENGTERTLNQVRLHEVSIVAFPAYTATNGTTSVRGLDRIAERADVDADQLADALLKIESGMDMTIEEKSLITKVLDTLAPDITETQDEFDGQAWLALKKKKLETLIKKA